MCSGAQEDFFGLQMQQLALPPDGKGGWNQSKGPQLNFDNSPAPLRAVCLHKSPRNTVRAIRPKPASTASTT